MLSNKKIFISVSVLAVLVSVIALPNLCCAKDSPADYNCNCPEIDFSNFDIAPTFLDSIPPKFPEMARRAQIEGKVVVDAFILDSGDICEAKLVKGVNPLLDNSVRKAAFASSYLPATLAGHPVAGVLRITINFTHDAELWARKEWPTVQLAPPLISEVGVVNRQLPSGETFFPELSYEEITFWGDLSVAVYHSVLQQVEPLLAIDESLFRITHYLTLPVSEQPRTAEDWIRKGDLEVMTCTDEIDSRFCKRGRKFRFYNQQGEYVFGGESSFIIHYD